MHGEVYTDAEAASHAGAAPLKIIAASISSLMRCHSVGVKKSWNLICRFC
jgi:hypothetical protein